MSNVFTLDALRADIEREFAPVRIALSDAESVVLRNLMRLAKKERDQVLALLTELEPLTTAEASDASTMERVADIAGQILALVSDDKTLGRKLLGSVKDDVTLVLRLFQKWMEATQPGEAPHSPA